MQTPNLDDILKRGLGDARLESIAWTNGDVELELALPHGPPWPPRIRLQFEFVTNLRIGIDYGSFSGAPLLFDAEFTRLDPNEWQVRIEFGGAPDGKIVFQC